MLDFTEHKESVLTVSNKNRREGAHTMEITKVVLRDGWISINMDAALAGGHFLSWRCGQGY